MSRAFDTMTMSMVSLRFHSLYTVIRCVGSSYAQAIKIHKTAISFRKIEKYILSKTVVRSYEEN